MVTAGTQGQGTRSRTAAYSGTHLSVRMAAPALAAVFALLIPLHVVTLEGFAQDVMVVMASLAVVVSLVARRRIDDASERAATGLLTALCLAPMTNNIVHLAVEGRLEQTAMLMLTVVGVGAVCKSRLHAVGLIVTGCVAWVTVVVLTRPEPMGEVGQYAVYLALACMLSIGVFLVRRAVSGRLELARDELADQLVELDELRAVNELRLRRFRGVFDDSPVGIALADEEGAVVEANEAMCNLLGRPLAEVLGRRSAEFTHPRDRATLSSLGELVEESDDGIARVEGRYLRPDGSVRWAGLTVRHVNGPDGRPWTLAHVQDVTDRKQAQAQARTSRETLRSAVAIARATQQGVDPRPAILSSLLQLTTAGSASMIERLDDRRLVVTAHFGRGDAKGTVVDLDAQSATAHVWRTGEPVFASRAAEHPLVAHQLLQAAATSMLWQPVGAAGAVRAVLALVWHDREADVSELERIGVEAVATEAGAALLAESMRQDLEATTVTDPLTGLLNRRGWDREMEGAVRMSRRTGKPFTVALVDLDHFKGYNDTHGHLAGDEMLRIFSDYAGSAVRDVDVVARWGGEEFSVMLRDTDAESAYEVLDRFRAGSPGGVTCSIGFAVHGESESVAECIARADAALYAAKGRGRDRVEAAPPSRQSPG